MSKCAVAVKMSVAAVGCVLGVATNADARAVPARTVEFDGGNCTAKFVRSASGIVNETHRECVGDQNPWIDADVRLQFRPLDGKPNPTCDPQGLVTTFVWSNTDPALAQYFPDGSEYNVCVYLEEPIVESGTIDSAAVEGTTTAAIPLAGTYEVCVRGTYTNRGGTDLLDAEYVSQDNWATFADGLPASDPLSAELGAGFGDVQVNGQFVEWGAYSADHKYCTTMALADGATLNLAVFDGHSADNHKMPEWYADNAGMLDYTIQYVGP